MSLLSANAVPLPDVLPWADVLPPRRTVLVNDSVGTDGRFLLHTLASQTLRGGSGSGGGGGGGVGNSGTGGSTFRRAPADSNTSASAPSSSSAGARGRVLWLGCTPATAKQIASALKKIGCDASLTAAAAIGGGGSASSSARSRRLEIVPIMLEAATEILSSDDEGGENNDALGSDYLKKLYRRIKAWLNESSSSQRQQPNLIIVDDATSLASIFGPRNVEFFLRQVRSLALRRGSPSASASMAILCSTDADQDRYLTTMAKAGGAAVNVAGGGSTKSTWIGAGSDVMGVEQEYQRIVGAAGATWERNLVELADGIIDVMPLQSGFSLEAHGRLVFTERKGGRGWRDATSPSGRRLPSTARPASSSATGAPAFLTTVVNYCCEESSVKAFRLRSLVS